MRLAPQWRAPVGATDTLIDGGISHPPLFHLSARRQAALLSGRESALFDDSHLLADLDEGVDALVEVLTLVTGRYLHADAGLAFGNNGELIIVLLLHKNSVFTT